MSLKKNVIANYLGQGWTALMGIVFMPLYIKHLGIEAYGLIGVFAILQAWLTLLDMGMTPTLNREMARFKAGALSAEAILNLLRSIEWVCLGLSILIVLAISFAATTLSNKWLKVENLATNVVIQAIIIMGFVIATRLWEEVYRAAIRGMQQQVWLNIAQAMLATLRWVGALFIIILVSPTIQAFFFWQGLVSVVSVIVYAFKIYRWLPDFQYGGRFSMPAIKSVWRFAGGMMTITLLALLLTQIDKLLLSGLLPLEQFGYYALAGVVVGGLAQLVTPMNAAIYPRFTELITQNDTTTLIKTYHEACQLMTAIIVPPALVLAAFAKPILLLWTSNAELTASVAPILSVMVLGTMLNAFLNIPYMLQLAYGWTKLSIIVNMVAVSIIIPAILWVVPRYGAVGAAWVWVMLNSGYVLLAIHFMYRRLIPDQKWRWYRESVFTPLLVGAGVAFGLNYVMNIPVSRIEAVIMLMIASVVVMTSVALTLTSLRQRVFKLIIYFLR